MSTRVKRNQEPDDELEHEREELLAAGATPALANRLLELFALQGHEHDAEDILTGGILEEGDPEEETLDEVLEKVVLE